MGKIFTSLNQNASFYLLSNHNTKMRTTENVRLAAVSEVPKRAQSLRSHEEAADAVGAVENFHL